MGRLQLAVCLLLACALTASAVSASSSSADWSPSTLLEHTAIASGRWAPTPRNRLEKLSLTQTPRPAEFLGASVNQELFFGADSRGGASDSSAEQRENEGRAREPQSDHFGVAAHGGLAETASEASVDSSRAPRENGCQGQSNCSRTNREHEPVVAVRPPPPAPKLPEKPVTPKKPAHRSYPVPPPPENPLPTPPKPSCGEYCNPDAKDPILARVPPAPLGDEALAAVGLEGKVLKNILTKLKNREGWLRSQKLWLSKAVEAAATVRREIELAEFTKNAVASDLEQLKAAQDALSIKYKADRLKWSFKDKKITLEELKERHEALEHAKADVSNQIREFKDEVNILESTLGPPSQQVQISPAELEDPLAFLKDIPVEENFEA